METISTIVITLWSIVLVFHVVAGCISFIYDIAIRKVQLEQKNNKQSRKTSNINPCSKCDFPLFPPGIHHHPCYINVICINCGNESAAFTDVEAAIEDWNKNNERTESQI